MRPFKIANIYNNKYILNRYIYIYIYVCVCEYREIERERRNEVVLI